MGDHGYRTGFVDGLEEAAMRIRYYLKHQDQSQHDPQYWMGMEHTCENLNKLLQDMIDGRTASKLETPPGGFDYTESDGA